MPGGIHGHLDIKTGINYARDAHLPDPYPLHVLVPRRNHRSDMSYQPFSDVNQPFETEEVSIVIDDSNEEVRQSYCQVSRDPVGQSVNQTVSESCGPILIEDESTLPPGVNTEKVVLGKRNNPLSKNKNCFSESFSTDAGQKHTPSENQSFIPVTKRKKSNQVLQKCHNCHKSFRNMTDHLLESLICGQSKDFVCPSPPSKKNVPPKLKRTN